MNKHLPLIFLCLSLTTNANTMTEKESSIALRNELLKSMGEFNPATVLPQYTENPREATFRHDEVASLGTQRIEQDHDAREVYQQAESSHAVSASMTNPEAQLGRDVIENAEETPTDIACAEGQCDSTVVEVSDDLNEGLVRLGSVSASANEASQNQVQNGVPGIFSGQALDCKKYVLGIRDCCTDSGWGNWVVHCPANLQALQKAKAESRVVYLGSYRKHKLDLGLHYTFCVFPTRLASIVQIQGRGSQLHVPFGSPKNPVCRGITPEELARINFKALDLSPLTEEFKNHVRMPDVSAQSQSNQAHIERLSREGLAHD